MGGRSGGRPAIGGTTGPPLCCAPVAAASPPGSPDRGAGGCNLAPAGCSTDCCCAAGCCWAGGASPRASPDEDPCDSTGAVPPVNAGTVVTGSNPKCFRIALATSSSRELEWVLRLSTPSSGNKSMIFPGLTSSSRANSLIRIFIEPRLSRLVYLSSLASGSMSAAGISFIVSDSAAATVVFSANSPASAGESEVTSPLSAGCS